MCGNASNASGFQPGEGDCSIYILYSIDVKIGELYSIVAYVPVLLCGNMQTRSRSQPPPLTLFVCT